MKVFGISSNVKRIKVMPKSWRTEKFFPRNKESRYFCSNLSFFERNITSNVRCRPNSILYFFRLLHFRRIHKFTSVPCESPRGRKLFIQFSLYCLGYKITDSTRWMFCSFQCMIHTHTFFCFLPKVINIHCFVFSKKIICISWKLHSAIRYQCCLKL